jgi:hypothetical protein
VKTTSTAICSVATLDYLPRLVVLYKSILQHQHIPLFILAADIDPQGVAGLTRQLYEVLPDSASNNLKIITPFDIYGEEATQMRFYYDAFEFATACKAGIHTWMQRNSTIDRWLFIDSDILCFGSLDPIFDALDGHGIFLTPHINKPGQTLLEDMQFLSAGAFNGGVLGVRRSHTSQRFTDWYLKILSCYCLNDPALPWQERFFQSSVIFVDQRWLDLVPAYFPDVAIASSRGFNLGHWNVGQDRLEFRHGLLYIDKDKITLLHLSGWLEDQPGRLSRHSSLDWSNDPEWNKVHNLYRDALAPLKDLFNMPYPFNIYSDGTKIPKTHRRAYLRHLLAGGTRLDNPFKMRSEFERALAPRPVMSGYRWS